MNEGKEITLAGEKIILSQRCVMDVSATSEFSQSHLYDAGNLQNLYVLAVIVSDSIAETRKHIGWWQFLKKIRYKKFNVKWILKNLPPSVLVSAYEQVILEKAKSKMPPSLGSRIIEGVKSIPKNVKPSKIS
jgi:hypothetical protein